MQQSQILMGNKQVTIKNTIDTVMFSRITLGGGCFWCVEATLQRLKGVQKVQPGYAGGFSKDPTYTAVCSGQTGHAQVVRVSFDPAVINYQTILYIFMHLHDPTTLNRQGNDTGTQYRSCIFYEKDNGAKELEVIKAVLDEVRKDGQYMSHPAAFVTEVKELEQFYPAEESHKEYYNNNSNEGYCRATIKPKIGKLASLFKNYLDAGKL